VALVEEPVVPQLAHEPPDGLDVVVGEGPVGVGRVDPHAGALGQRRPVLDVAADRGPAALVERLDAVGLDLVLGVQAELALDLELDGEAVAIPPALAGHVAAAHGLEAREQVLERPRPHVVQARLAVGGGRPLVEDPRLGALAQPADLLDDLALAPTGDRPFFEGGQVEVGGNGTERHRALGYGGAPGGPARVARATFEGATWQPEVGAVSCPPPRVADP
jgi:hypothetical protein